MRHLNNLLIALIAVSIFMTACNQDQSLDQELAQMEQQTTQKDAPLQDDAENDPESNDEFLKANDEFKAEDQLVSIDKNAVKSRDGEPILFNLSTDKSETINCGQSKYSNTYNSGNDFGNTFYNHFGFTTNLNGNDKVYYFTINEESMVTHTLTNTHNNMAMFLLKGNYKLVCNSWGCYYDLRFDEVVDYSTSTSSTYETLGSNQLKPGKYMLIVDGAPYKNSVYNLYMYCQPVISACGTGTALANDQFEKYALGHISNQSTLWSKWNSGAAYDGEVGENGGNQYMKVERKYTTDANQPDVLLRLSERKYGKYELKFNMWIYNGHTGYFNVQKNLTYNNANNEFGGEVYFKDNGYGEVKVAGKTIPFYYTHNKWMQVKLIVNLDYNTVSLYIDGNYKAGWKATDTASHAYGTKQIEAIDFYPYRSDSQFFIDRVCFSKM